MKKLYVDKDTIFRIAILVIIIIFVVIDIKYIKPQPQISEEDLREEELYDSYNDGLTEGYDKGFEDGIISFKEDIEQNLSEYIYEYLENYKIEDADRIIKIIDEAIKDYDY